MKTFLLFALLVAVILLTGCSTPNSTVLTTTHSRRIIHQQPVVASDQEFWPDKPPELFPDSQKIE